LAIGLVQAEEYQVVVAYPPGNQSDLITRAIADSIARNTQDRLVISNVPGGENVVAVTHFKNNPNIDLITTVSSMVVFNPVLKKNLSYNDKDFNHIAYIGASINLWVTRPDTKLKTPEDLIRFMPRFVGGYASSSNYNLTALAREKNIQSTTVSYKGINETMVDLLNGSIDLALLTVNGTVSSMVKSGKLRIIGSSYPEDLIIDDINIPSVSKRLRVTQFNGFVAYATQSSASPEQVAKLKKLIWDALQDPVAQASINKTNIVFRPTVNQNEIYQKFNHYREQVAKYSQE
jgi:tripartite-type tricarboxylate transporter receptor subunit TctC